MKDKTPNDAELRREYEKYCNRFEELFGPTKVGEFRLFTSPISPFYNRTVQKQSFDQYKVLYPVARSNPHGTWSSEMFSEKNKVDALSLSQKDEAFRNFAFHQLSIWDDPKSVTLTHSQNSESIQATTGEKESFLIVINTKNKKLMDKTHVIKNRESIIGRDNTKVDFLLESPFVSRTHAKLYKEYSGCYIEDLNSTNGVFLNGNQIYSSKLKAGDQLKLGDVILSFTSNSSEKKK